MIINEWLDLFRGSLIDHPVFARQLRSRPASLSLSLSLSLSPEILPIPLRLQSTAPLSIATLHTPYITPYTDHHV